jgi:hypothetical protein
MAQTAAHVFCFAEADLVERVIPWVPTRQWVVSVPIQLRYWRASSEDLTAMVHTIIRTTIGQYYVNKAVTRGFERANMQPESVTFIQRFGSAINLNLYFHCVFLEGVYLDRTEAGLTPRFVTGEPPTEADIAAVITKISHRVMRKLRQLGYLEAGLDATVAADTHPWSDGTTGIRLPPVELLEKLAALVPLSRVHLVRYGGCLASHSHLRGAIIPTPRQQGIDEEATGTGSPRWTWAQLLKRVLALDMARCPWCQRGRCGL